MEAKRVGVSYFSANHMNASTQLKVGKMLLSIDYPS